MNAKHAALAQFDLIWTFAELHFNALHEDDFLWAPTELHWNVHPDENGVWYPDWADTEPDPIPVPTIAWLTWQVICPPQAGVPPSCRPCWTSCPACRTAAVKTCRGRVPGLRPSP